MRVLALAGRKPPLSMRLDAGKAKGRRPSWRTALAGAGFWRVRRADTGRGDYFLRFNNLRYLRAGKFSSCLVRLAASACEIWSRAIPTFGQLDRDRSPIGAYRCFVAAARPTKPITFY